MAGNMSAFCRDCLADVAADTARCPQCRSRRIVAHEELHELTIAHLDCDAFYAAIEKRDDPSLAGKPVIVGGGRRGVVSTCCYIARIDGVRSAMPMFKALELCPHATVIKPDMAKYVAEGRRVRAMMRDLTPLVEPLSLDEAYLDLSGTERLHGRSPAKTMALLAVNIEAEIGITVSIGLSCNKFLAKLASELDKPRGFAVIGSREASAFLRDKPVGMIRGAGAALQARLARDGITRIGQLQDADRRELAKRYGSTGLWLHRLANAEDSRPVDPSGEMKSISSETTFNENIAKLEELERILWRQCERVSARAKAMDLGGRTVTLKLKTAGFRIRTRSVTLDAPTQLADRIFGVSRTLLHREADGTSFRLLGAGLHNICAASACDPADLVDKGAGKRARAERAMDKVRAKFGGEAVGKGRGLGARKHDQLSPNRSGH
jgi:DNA polymerase-4